MIGTDIAIDLGTSRFKVYLDGKGIVISEPSIIAVDNLTEEVIAVGATPITCWAAPPSALPCPGP